jgi:hypothetical protein
MIVLRGNYPPDNGLFTSRDGHRFGLNNQISKAVIYQHWITLETYKKHYDGVMSHPDRPKPPQ